MMEEQISVFRSNLVDNHLSLLLATFINAGLLEVRSDKILFCCLVYNSFASGAG